MLTTKNDVYVRILEWANENQGFSFGDILNAFPDQKELINKTIQKGQVFIQVSPNSDKYMLNFESRFNLLEYEELNDARQSSKRAMTIAIISILLTLFSIIYSIVFVSKVEIVNMDKIVKTIQAK
jgi:hypothetical protein